MVPLFQKMAKIVAAGVEGIQDIRHIYIGIHRMNQIVRCAEVERCPPIEKDGSGGELSLWPSHSQEKLFAAASGEVCCASHTTSKPRRFPQRRTTASVPF